METVQTVLNWIGVGIFVVFFFGFCVFIHEFGHLLAALWRGLHVESFSIGFGKRLWGFKHNGIDYKISLLPFGGYVELPQLETAEEWSDSKGNSLPAVSPVDRLITAFAGPFFNILFGLFLGCFVWWFGVDQPPKGTEVEVGRVWEKSVEYAAGLRSGDVIFKVDGKTFENGWGELREELIITTKDKATLTFKRGEEIKEITYDLVPSEDPRFEGLYVPNFMPENLCVVERLFKGTPAEAAGIEAGDQIVSINEKKIIDASEVTKTIRFFNGKNLTFVLKRNGETLTVGPFDAKITDNYVFGAWLFDEPVADFAEKGNNYFQVYDVDKESFAFKAGLKQYDLICSVNGKSFAKGKDLEKYIDEVGKESFSIAVKRPTKFEGEGLEKRGVEFEDITLKAGGAELKYIVGIGTKTLPVLVKAHPDPISQLVTVLNKTWRTVKALAAPDSKIGVKHMSGPIGIAKVLGQAVSHSFMQGIALVVFISFSLAIMNLLPLPVLDGGHITFSIIELVFRRKLPIKFMKVIETTFVILLLTMMLSVTVFGDLGRLFPDSVPVVVQV